MRVALLTAAMVVGVCLMAGADQAQEKEVTLKGKLMCAHCALMQGTECQTIIEVKEGGKDVTYYFKDKGNAETYHEPVCGGQKKDGTVVGKVAEKDGKKWVTPTKVTYDKK